MKIVNPLTQQMISNEEIKQLSDLIKKQRDLEQELEELEKLIKEKTNELRNFSEIVIPGVMEQLGISELKLSDGTHVEVKTFYNASISPERAEEAFTWLRENGWGEIIKRNLTCVFGKGEDELADKVLKTLKKLGTIPTDKTFVHPQTLKAFVRDQIESGNALPTDLLGVFVGKRVKLTPS